VKLLLQVVKDTEAHNSRTVRNIRMPKNKVLDLRI